MFFCETSSHKIAHETAYCPLCKVENELETEERYNAVLEKKVKELEEEIRELTAEIKFNEMLHREGE